MSYTLTTMNFVRRKQGELQDLVAFFKRPLAHTDYVYGFINEELVLAQALQLASHTFCCYVLMREELESIPDTVPASLAIAYLEHRLSWLSLEIDLAIKGLFAKGIVAKPTLAPLQLIEQWYIGQFYAGLQLLKGSEVSEDDELGVRDVFRCGSLLIS